MSLGKIFVLRRSRTWCVFPAWLHVIPLSIVATVSDHLPSLIMCSTAPTQSFWRPYWGSSGTVETPNPPTWCWPRGIHEPNLRNEICVCVCVCYWHKKTCIKWSDNIFLKQWTQEESVVLSCTDSLHSSMHHDTEQFKGMEAFAFLFDQLVPIWPLTRGWCFSRASRWRLTADVGEVGIEWTI